MSDLETSLKYIYLDIKKLIKNDDAYVLNDILEQYPILVDYRNEDEQSWMHLASQFGTWSCMEVLHEHGLKVNVTDLIGDTPLHKALLNQHKSASEWLLVNGADPNITNVYGITPLMYAAFWSKDMVDVLISCGGDTSIKDNKGHGIKEWSQRGIKKAQQILALFEAQAEILE